MISTSVSLVKLLFKTQALSCTTFSLPVVSSSESRDTTAHVKYNPLRHPRKHVIFSKHNRLSTTLILIRPTNFVIWNLLSLLNRIWLFWKRIHRNLSSSMCTSRLRDWYEVDRNQVMSTSRSFQIQSHGTPGSRSVFLWLLYFAFCKLWQWLIFPTVLLRPASFCSVVNNYEFAWLCERVAVLAWRICKNNGKASRFSDESDLGLSGFLCFTLMLLHNRTLEANPWIAKQIFWKLFAYTLTYVGGVW